MANCHSVSQHAYSYILIKQLASEQLRADPSAGAQLHEGGSVHLIMVLRGVGLHKNFSLAKSQVSHPDNGVLRGFAAARAIRYTWRFLNLPKITVASAQYMAALIVRHGYRRSYLTSDTLSRACRQLWGYHWHQMLTLVKTSCPSLTGLCVWFWKVYPSYVVNVGSG